MRPAGRIRSGAASEYPRAASSGAAARARSRSRGLFALPFALGVVTLVVGVVAVPRAVARDPRRRRVEPAASTQRLHCLPHSLVRRLVHRLFARHCFRPGSPVAPGTTSISAAFRLCMAQMQRAASREGKRLLNVRTLRGPSYGVEATSLAISFGMPQICTSDMAAHGSPGFSPSGERNSLRFTVCTLITIQVYGTCGVLRNG